MSLFPFQDNEQSAAVRKRCDTAVDNRMYEARPDDVQTFPPPNSLFLNVQTVTDSGLWFVFPTVFAFHETTDQSACGGGGGSGRAPH